ncbi:GNAT family N-acetyltransferase [Terrabacter sp. BE26]|uniref:GNAT family N-acetyltransferase n=1 Tax=Terrabacter sp. BE26 TaxID=2898152 RepID=UPI0035BE8221
MSSSTRRAIEHVPELLGPGNRLGLAVEADNTPAVRLYESLGFERHPTIAPVDVWTWTDENGVTHEQCDPCTYWTREPLSL